ncbi:MULTISPECIES: hypothetical protein [unclassified Chryseobacterium]|uniref:hypothetical protein n=1 Tax=unclassified Chryseobacterium TaxID=2593645 RepID=UPI0004E72C67|nr:MULTISPECIES: hypothetical protein [unclassified Chryseobacterium]KFF22363.1 hypothetical protein IW22_04050 [Chryseobacterium sp. JM1]SHG30665.1 hypothetical protein SAMN02787100_3753 [Chryseobacterium sp. OV279]
MNLTEEDALAIGLKVMSDINFNYDNNAKIDVKYLERGKYHDFNCWLLSFPYGFEDFDRHIYGNLMIDADTGIVKNDISIRNGSIVIEYNEDKDKYFIIEKRP